MKSKFPYQLAQGDQIQENGQIKTVSGVRMLANKVCQVFFEEGGSQLIPYIRVVQTVEQKQENRK